VLSDSLFDDVSDVLETWSKLLHLVVAQSNIVGDIALVTCNVECFLELVLGLIKLFFFEQHAPFSHNCLC